MDGSRGSFDFDWLVIGSGFGGSVSALRLSEKGYSVGVLECGRRFADHEFPKSTADLKRYFWNPRLGMKGIFRLTTFKDVVGRLGLRRRRRQPRLREHPVRAAEAVLRGPPVGRHGGLGAASWRPHYAEAQRMLGVVAEPARGPRRPAAARARRGARRRRHLQTDARRHLLRRARQDRRRPVLRRRGSRPHRLPPVRALHGRLRSTAPRTRSSRTTCTSPRSAARR